MASIFCALLYLLFARRSFSFLGSFTIGLNTTPIVAALIFGYAAAASAQEKVDARFYVTAPDQKPDGSMWDYAADDLRAFLP